jgi:Arc/MetJ family transcription regulator
VAPALWDDVPKSSPSAHEPLPPQAPVPPPPFAEVRQTGPEALVANAVTFLRRQPKSQGVFEMLMKGSKPTAVVSACRPELEAALRRYLDARRARETQTALADEMTAEFARALEGANSQERHAAAELVAEAYEKICSLTQIELDLMVAAKVIRRSDFTERQMDIQDSIEGDEMFGLPERYVQDVQAAADWRNIAEFEKAIHFQETRANQWRVEGVSRG